MTTNDSARVGTDEQGLLVERVFDASRELLWRAWTEPQHFARWYGPAGFSLPTCEIDFRVGGRHLFGMRSPDGQGYTTTGVYREIVPLERFVYTDAMADEHGDVVAMMPETVVTVTFADLGDGKTRVTLRQAGWPDENMAAGASFGWNAAFDKLVEVLTNI